MVIAQSRLIYGPIYWPLGIYIVNYIVLVNHAIYAKWLQRLAGDSCVSANPQANLVGCVVCTKK